MKFIYWTIAYWTLNIVSEHLQIWHMGGWEAHRAFYGGTVIGLSALTVLVLWIALYKLFVVKEV